MILINEVLCGKDLRKVGIIYATINIVLLILLLIAVAFLRGNILMATGSFIVLYIILHSLLIHGFHSKKSSYLTLWLAFAPFEIIASQTVLLFFLFSSILYSAYAAYWLCIPMLLLYLLITTFTFHNVCVVFSVRHKLIYDRDVQNATESKVD